jgi:hypothetical protein
MSNPKLALIPSGYKGGTTPTVYSILPSDSSGDFTFDRANGLSTRVRKDGLIEEVSNDTPRLDWLNSDCPVLLLENESTNRLTYSSDFDNWSKVNITVASDSQISPSGEYNADTITRNSALASYVSKSFSKPTSSELDMTLSVFVKQNVGDFFAMRSQGFYPSRADIIFQFSTKTFTTSVSGTNFSLDSTKYEDYGNGWYRLSAKFNTDAYPTLACLFSARSLSGQVDSTDSSSDSSVYLWGAQCELGNLTSFIPTTTSTQTRFAETCTDAGDATIFNDSEGVLYAEIKALSNTDTTNPNRGFSISDSSTNNTIFIYFQSANNSFSCIVISGGVTQFSNNTTSFNVTNYLKVALKYKKNANEIALWINGVEVATETNAIIPTGLSQVAFHNGAGNDKFYGNCKELRYYDTALTDAELTELTT